MIPVEGHPNLYRDENTGAIVNCDESEYLAYKRALKSRMNQKSEIENLKDEVSQIKSLLMELINETRRD
jgi:hypothetical protein